MTSPRTSLTLTYRLRAEDPVYGQAFTNAYANIDFTPIPENTFYPTGPVELTFPMPDVPVPPIAVDDAYTVNAGATLTIAAPGVLVNDISAIQRPSGWSIDPDIRLGRRRDTTGHGDLTQNPDGSLTYVPDPGFSGVDTYVYKISSIVTKGQNPVTLEDTAWSPSRSVR